ncbi:hypothetical protein MSPP1_001371 [Malassezia sp. CBS 17886]|nr:hypothetical protein MSPP1_001371 [Malassezia sp. CBS 17886]
MGALLGNETKIILLLVVDVVFFFVEIISGYAVGSLALVADSFHMLNDVMSLIVALYAVRLANKQDKHHQLSYGWQRAEILGALFNGVFLLALCFSIFMEALERIVNTPEVSNPRLIVVVGSLGLASNIAGLFLFNGHAHVHGHSHSHDIEAPGHAHDHVRLRESDDGSDDDLLDRAQVGELVGHPAKARAFVMNKAQSLGYDAGSPSHKSTGQEGRALLAGARGRDYGAAPRGGSDSGEQEQGHAADHAHTHEHAHAHDHAHTHEHDESRPLTPAELRITEAVRAHRAATGAPAHSHENMNMTGVFLHVLGDAVGNTGVIITGLFIWLTDHPWRFYADPLISFVIACIIFSSALPLVKSASFILLQGVPTSVSLDGVRDSVLKVNGVLGVHDLHIWQLNENKIVASLHVLVDCSEENSKRYMEIAHEVRRTMHLWGIHSSTIQAEFVPGGLKEAARLSGLNVPDGSHDDQGRLLTSDGNLVEAEISQRDPACLLSCDRDECGESQCCPQGAGPSAKDDEAHAADPNDAAAGETTNVSQ